MKINAQLMGLFMIAACSSSSGGGGDGDIAVTGSFGSASFAHLDNALAAVVTSGKGAGLDIILTDGADCAAVTAGETAGATYLELFLSATDGSGNFIAPTGPGTFTTDVTGPGPYVEGDVEELGSDCSQTVSGQFGGGTVTLTSLDGNVAAGSVALTDGGTASGTFTTVSCPGIATIANDDGSAACH